MDYHLQNRLIIKIQKRHFPIQKYLLGLILILLFIQVLVSNRLATTGTVIIDTESKIADLTQQNSNLREKIASASALVTIKQKAVALGLDQQIKPIYLSEKLPVALDLR